MTHPRVLPITTHPAPAAPAHRAHPRPDVGSAADLHALLTAFYAAVGHDPLLAPFFADLDIAAHLPRIVDFWSTLLLHTGRYSGSVFEPHRRLVGLTPAHFARWVAALEATVDARHAGPNADRMTALAHRIAHSMQLRLGVGPTDPHSAPPTV